MRKLRSPTRRKTRHQATASGEIEGVVRARLTGKEDHLSVRDLRPVAAANVSLARALARTREDRVGVQDLDEVALAFGWVRLARGEVGVDEAERAVVEYEAQEDRALVAVRLVEACLDALGGEVANARLDRAAGEHDREELGARVCVKVALPRSCQRECSKRTPTSFSLCTRSKSGPRYRLTALVSTRSQWLYRPVTSCVLVAKRTVPAYQNASAKSHEGKSTATESKTHGPRG